MGFDKKWTYIHISINVILISLVLYTFFVKMAFKCFSCGKKNTNPGYMNKDIEDEIFEKNGIERGKIG